MGDIISRQAAIDELSDKYHGMVSDESMKIYQIINWLDNLPSAEPQERKTGRWIDETFKPWGLVHHPYRCSLCGEHAEYDSMYCPNCGAMMEADNEKAKG